MYDEERIILMMQNFSTKEQTDIYFIMILKWQCFYLLSSLNFKELKSFVYYPVLYYSFKWSLLSKQQQTLRSQVIKRLTKCEVYLFSKFNLPNAHILCLWSCFFFLFWNNWWLIQIPLKFHLYLYIQIYSVYN